MNWNHRVIRHREKAPDGSEETTLAFAEVYYDEGESPRGWCYPFMLGDDEDELKTLLKRLSVALSQPILEASDMEEQQ
jgi:hypothetical protein